MKIVVIGGAGLIGLKVTIKLRERGHQALAPSPSSGVDTVSGEGLAEALRDASVVIDASNPPSLEGETALKFFQTSTRNLLKAETSAGVKHHVALSVVAAERLTEGDYFRAKVAQEGLILASSIPYSIVRATQLFESVAGIADAASDGDTVHLAPVLIQPIAADDVATVLSRIALGRPLNHTVQVAGPDQYRLDELIRAVFVARNDPRQVVTDAQAPFLALGLLEDRTLMPGSPARLAGTHFRDWLREADSGMTDIDKRPRISGDIYQIDPQTWAIHGYIPGDGEVILGSFDSREAASAVLDEASRGNSSGQDS
jgi:uncharacterized protein YbjT (DUF2867 family)